MRQAPLDGGAFDIVVLLQKGWCKSATDVTDEQSPTSVCRAFWVLSAEPLRLGHVDEDRPGLQVARRVFEQLTLVPVAECVVAALEPCGHDLERSEDCHLSAGEVLEQDVPSRPRPADRAPVLVDALLVGADDVA